MKILVDNLEKGENQSEQHVILIKEKSSEKIKSKYHSLKADSEYGVQVVLEYLSQYHSNRAEVVKIFSMNGPFPETKQSLDITRVIYDFISAYYSFTLSRKNEEPSLDDLEKKVITLGGKVVIYRNAHLEYDPKIDGGDE
jgi:hypothetical protein